jgi:cellulose synthase/poly-beta-1,6-N-acetylglucosamine synthase-like glycosyltransferase
MTPDAYEFQTVVLAVASGVIAIGIIQNATYLFQLALAYFVLRRRAPLPDAIGAWWKLSDSTMPISLLVPAYNEETTIVENVRSLLSLHYPNFEVVVINDGSSDGTLKAVVEAFGLAPVQRYFKETVKHRPIRSLHGSARFPRLLVVDKENGGKSDALNTGINLSRKPVFCAVDADSVLEADALLRAIQPFAERPDRVVAVGGTIRLANGCAVRSGRVVDIGLPRSLLALLQVTEYLRAFLMARLAWSHVNALMLISGAFGIIRRDVAIDV